MSVVWHSNETLCQLKQRKSLRLQTVKSIKGWIDTRFQPLDSESHNVNISHEKGLTTKQASRICI